MGYSSGMETSHRHKECNHPSWSYYDGETTGGNPSTVKECDECGFHIPVLEAERTGLVECDD